LTIQLSIVIMTIELSFNRARTCKPIPRTTKLPG
jgi:hypothetical protein